MRVRLVTVLLLLFAFFASSAQADTVTGRVRAVHKDFFDRGYSTNVYQVLTSTGPVTLRTSKNLNSVIGKKLTIQGSRVKDSIKPRKLRVLHVPPLRRSSVGSHATAVILANFAGDTRQPYTSDQVRQAIFTSSLSVSNFYKTQSFGLISLTGKLRTDGDVFGWYTIPDSTSSCLAGQWAQDAQAQATANGVNLTGYQHIIVLWPYQSTCAWSGMGYMPGSLVEINGSLSPQVIEHELGHNIGGAHSSSLACKNTSGIPVPLSNTCTFSEYGDQYDPLGLLAPVQMNGYHKAQFGWDNVRKITAPGSYTITLYPTDFKTTGTQLVQVPRGTLNVTSYIYIDFRAPGPFNTWTDPLPTMGVQVRIGPDLTSFTQAKLLNMHPNSGKSAYDSAPLSVGQTFSNPTSGVYVTLVSLNPRISATIRVVKK